jgi:hypothetical protein
VTFVSIDHIGREGYLRCNHPVCQEKSLTFASNPFDPQLPEGWLVSQRFDPGPRNQGHLCPTHAGLA